MDDAAWEDALEKYRQEVFRRKAEARIEIAARPFTEKLAILDQLRESDEFLRPFREQYLRKK